MKKRTCTPTGSAVHRNRPIRLRLDDTEFEALQVVARLHNKSPDEMADVLFREHCTETLERLVNLICAIIEQRSSTSSKSLNHSPLVLQTTVGVTANDKPTPNSDER